MIPVKQKVCDKKVGDCFRACMASLLELPNVETLPHIASESWFSDWSELLRRCGLRLCCAGADGPIWKEGYWLAIVPSLNFQETTHAIVMQETYVAFDPSPKKRYRKRRSLIGEELVRFGYWIEVSDVGKIHELDKIRMKLAGA